MKVEQEAQQLPVTDSRPKTLFSNAAWNLALNCWTFVVGFFYAPFLINRIGPDHYGLFILLMSVSGFLGIMNLGLGEATLRYVAYYYGRNDMKGINRVVGATLGLYVVIATMVVAIMYISAPLLIALIAIPAQEYRLGASLLRITGLTFGLRLLGEGLRAIPTALQRYDISTRVSIAESLFHLGGTVTLTLMGYGILQLVMWGVATAIFVQVINVITSQRLLPALILKPSLSRSGLTEVFSFGVFSFIKEVFGIIWSHADRLLLGLFVSTSSVAYLTVPQNLSFRASYALYNVGSVLFPKFSATKEDEARFKICIDSTWVFLCGSIVLFVPLTVLIPDILRLWISPEFALRSAWVGQVIAFSCIIRGAFVPYDSLLKGIGKPQYLSFLYFCSGLTGLLLNAILIPKYGLSGAGYCYVVTPVWGLLTIMYTWKYVFREKSFKPLTHILLLPCGSGVIALLAFTLIRAHREAPEWLGVASLGFSFVIILIALLLGVDYVLKRSHSQSLVLINYLRQRVFQ